MLTEIALFATLAMVLDIFTAPIKIGPWISISFKMLPIFLISLRRGTQAGVLAGLIWGTLQIITGQAVFLNLLQGVLEYFVAFSLIGCTGLIKPQLDRAKTRIQQLSYLFLGILIGATSRYIIHFIAGIIFWGSYAPKGQSPILYSLIINSASWLGELVPCFITIYLIYNYIQPLLQPKK